MFQDQSPVSPETVHVVATVSVARRSSVLGKRFDYGPLGDLIGEEFYDVKTNQWTGRPKDGPGYCLASFRPGGTRCQADVESVYGAVLDVDGPPGNRLGQGLSTQWAQILFEAIDLAGFAYIAHTTRRHSPSPRYWCDFHRYRVIIPFAQPAMPHCYRPTVEMILKRIADAGNAIQPSRGWTGSFLLDGVIDRSVFDYSHRYNWPECQKHTRQHARLWCRPGWVVQPVVMPLPEPKQFLAALEDDSGLRSFSSVEELSGYLLAHPSSNESIRETVEFICSGQPFPDNAVGHDDALWRAALSMARIARGATGEQFIELATPSVLALQSAGSKLNIDNLRSKVQRAMQQIEKTPSPGPPPEEKKPKRRAQWSPETRVELETYIHDSCLVGTEYKINGEALYEDYLNWCTATGRVPFAQNSFLFLLERFGYPSKKRHGRMVRLGITTKKSVEVSGK